MKLNLEEWQFLTAILREKDLENTRMFRALYAEDKDVKNRWEIYEDCGEYVHDIVGSILGDNEATEQEIINVNRYSNLKHEEMLLNSLQNKFNGEAEL